MTAKVEPIAKNEYRDVHVLRGERFGEGPIKIIIHDKLAPDPRAQFAQACIERWGMIAGEANGEDSAGRQKSRLQTPAEVVERACNCAEEAFKQFEQRGWLLRMPAYSELIDRIKDQENSND